MGAVQTIVLEIAKNFIYSVSDPIFIGLVILILYMYKRQTKDTKDKAYKYRVEASAIKDILRGTIIGSIASVVLTSLGVKIQVSTGMLILIPITILLVAFNPKLGCFSYVIPLAYVCYQTGNWLGINFTWLKLPYDQMIILIGVLHIIEGFLVVSYGHENSAKIPLYKDNHLVVGYSLNKYWPVPLTVFQYSSGVTILVPIYALLGYGDVAIGESPSSKSRKMGAILVLYGIIITIGGYFVISGVISKGIVLLMMPVLHESMFLINH